MYDKDFELNDSDEETFKMHVNNDVRNQASVEISGSLRSSVCVGRWYRTLVSMKRNAELQVTLDKIDRSERKLNHETNPTDNGRLMWLEYVLERDKWAAGNARFKAGVEDKIDEAKSIRDQAPTKVIMTTAMPARIKTLEEAITAHRTEMWSEASKADTTLWAVLS